MPSRPDFPTTHPSRRQLLGWAGLGAGGLFLPRNALSSASPMLPAGSRQTPPPLEIALDAVVERRQFRPGPLTEVWRYQARLISGPPEGLGWTAGPLPAPVLRLRPGQTLKVHFSNHLPEASSIHWHGLAVPESMDGHPKDVVPSGGGRVYEFPILAEPATYWFHPHPHMRTAFQVAHGLAGFLLVVDPTLEADLPSGDRDLPLLIQDRSLNAANVNAYAQQMMGFLGDEVTVNGLAGDSIAVEQDAYRLRLLNGSVTRTYKLAWSDGRPLRAVATDAGLLPAPLDRPYLMLAPGERRDVVVDFSDLPAGAELTLRSLDWDSGGTGGMGMGRPSLIPEGSPFTVARFRAHGEGSRTRIFLPAAVRGAALEGNRPAPRAASRHAEPINATAVTPDRRVVLDHQGMMQWTLNGRSFEMEAVAPDEVVRLGTDAIWEWDNSVSTMMMIPHALHIHLVRFKVLERLIAPRQAAAYATVRDGLLDEGWKDTVLVMPGERVRVGMRFESYAGLFLYHCHMLDHEDMGMMRNFRVEGT
ncbi:MAG TPA: multicopper oxidase family protein [Anaerolineae bacterium]|nr:multicopper oxidase family protein [Anaerolineae bacterium]HRA18872.1 multicopper oxidase family protein [Anaerolineae bacterium]